MLLQSTIRHIFRNSRLFPAVARHNLSSMVDAKLEAVPLVEIDEGIFKYILIKVYGKEKADGSEPSKNIVRGFARAEWHNDIYEEVSSSLAGLGLETECLGGGRIEHRPEQKLIKVYGYSQGYGKADHQEARRILLTKYADCQIETSDEGY
ncbi:sex-regulated protein janus-A isoform X1 [Culex quinquefasciatus]|uniref:sex-regulated protein janus-A isoform X1 n=1 Tax=Culex quinquefasciatus TaxID=7176 RepID=UPI0018E2F92B|nr:sex-regulated protein janus-A isoform X1 [Culex quinquefasciatus]XP_039437844.1 sex-regulated protein janus-A-like isoform X1 [Culex pipiens pallens]